MNSATPPTSDLSDQFAHDGDDDSKIPEGGVFSRLWVAIRHRWLDWRLAEGADPAMSRALALRARQLTGRKERQKLACSIINRIREVDDPRPFGVTASPSRRCVRAARAELREMAELLLDPGPVYARGVALGWALLRSPDSPLYDGSEADSAWYWAKLASEALEGHI